MRNPFLSNDGTRTLIGSRNQTNTYQQRSNPRRRKYARAFEWSGWRALYSHPRKYPESDLPVPIGGEKKRLIDIIFAGSSLAFLMPLFGLIALLIKISDGGPVFYRHWRLGHARRRFACLKFRTMVLDGDEVLRHHLMASSSAAREWVETRKLKSDPRVTTIGAVLRKLSLDELPQLINILRGEMSIVGPRPIVSDEVKKYGSHAELYFKARPGLTGLWQISGRNDKSYDERVALDCIYVRGWSLSTDIIIIAKTIPAVLTSRGTY
jgi:exopolysaccharide production protein ExoY